MPLFVLLFVVACSWGLELPPERTPALPPGKWVDAVVTSYCGGPCAVCQTTGVTTSGSKTKVVPYNLASDRSLPLGTMIYLQPGLGALDRVRADDRFFKVDDRGGALDTQAREQKILRLDLRVIDHTWAIGWGVRFMKVYVITKQEWKRSRTP